jgi:hypothetical protein
MVIQLCGNNGFLHSIFSLEIFHIIPSHGFLQELWGLLQAVSPPVWDILLALA